MSVPDPDVVEEWFDRLAPLSAEARETALAQAALDPAVRAEVRRLLAYFDEPPLALREPVLRSDALAALTCPERIGPYAVTGVIGAGAVGVVYQARQESPAREVAVKVLRAPLAADRQAWRFEREAQLLGRFQHPGIAQIFESGTAVLGGAPVTYIAMEFVDGRPITDWAEEGGRSREERVAMLAELADAVHHAHLRGVIHRDLKPSNVLVSADGQVKVIDFGVARALDRGAEATVETLTGQVVGTLAYMSPEQVRGELDAIDARADVYGLGVLAFEVLSGHLPHDVAGATLTAAARTICEAVPKRLGELEPGCRGDLEWIVTKALAREPDRRYASADAFAADLRHWLRAEPVEARPDSALYRFSRLARRHRVALAGACATLVAILVGAGVAVHFAVANSRLAQREAAARDAAVEQSLLATRRAEEAERLRALALEHADEIVRRTDPAQLEEARRIADELWPATPATVPAMDRWLTELAVPLAERLPRHEAALAELRARAEPYGEAERQHDREHHPLRAELEALRADRERARSATTGRSALVPEPAERELAIQREAEAERVARIAELEARLDERWTWSFADPDLQRRHDALARLVADLGAFADPAEGLVAKVRARRERALGLEARTVTDPEPAAEWAAAVEAIRRSPRYGGLELVPVAGLRPLRADPVSGLWEFWHVDSGARPRPATDAGAPSAWEIGEETGLVLVLIPGGADVLGVQHEDPAAPNWEATPTAHSGPEREVVLESFFLSKYECTQAQWTRMNGGTPSLYKPTFTWYGTPIGPEVLHANTPWNPVENVSHREAEALLRRAALRLPSLDEWEYAARAGTDTPWWTGATAASLGAGPAGNLADARSREHGAPSHWRYAEWRDSWSVHAPVGDFPPNPFGLHDTVGNVLELCAAAPIYGAPAGVVTCVGGCFDGGPDGARVTYREFVMPNDRSGKVGCRPARSLP